MVPRCGVMSSTAPATGAPSWLDTTFPASVRGGTELSGVAAMLAESTSRVQLVEFARGLLPAQALKPINRVRRAEAHRKNIELLPNGWRLSCGAPKKNSFLNLRAPSASSAC